MTELSGQLAGVGLPAMVRFLSGLSKTGGLRLNQDDWSGEITFVTGEVTDARLGSRGGLGALDGMLEMFGEASFQFEPPAPGAGVGERTIHLSQDALLVHLDQAAARVATGARRLPRPNAVPCPAADGGGDEPLPLDRGTLQTLLAVDGQRSVRDIVDLRHSMEPVWQLASLAEVGLVNFDGNGKTGPLAVEPANHATASAAAMDASATTVITAAPTPPQTTEALNGATSVSHCPRLGFEDDPSSSFSRPTRLHRCFAAGGPTPLSLDQQRELCLSEHYGTCPRLTAVPTTPPARSPRPAPRRVPPTTPDEPRIVRLPFGSRLAASERKDRESPAAASEPTPLRPTSSPAREDTAPRPAATAPQLARMRARLERPAPAAASTGVATARPMTPSPPPSPPSRPASVESPQQPPVPPVRRDPPRPTGPAMPPISVDRRRIGQIPVVAIAAAGAVVLVVAALLYLLVPQLFGDSGLDEATLPNARLVQDGTPVTALAPQRATPIAVASAVPSSDGDAAQDTSGTMAQPTPAPAPLAQPSTAATQASPAPGASQTAATSDQSPTAALFDERFTNNTANWPSNPQGLGLFTNGSYRIATRQASQFAAIGVPLSNVPADVAVAADFRKLGGPDGGGYGIIVRDQQQSPRDGSSQDGRYYVLEVGDKGEVGIWRRDGDHWVDLLPWQHSDAVKAGTAANELTVRAVGDTLSFAVNGIEVATRTDSTFANGQLGVFVGGDGNQVALTRFTVQNP